MGAIKLADRAPREEVLYFKATINQTNSITEAPIQFIKKSMPAEVAIPFPPFSNKKGLNIWPSKDSIEISAYKIINNSFSNISIKLILTKYRKAKLLLRYDIILYLKEKFKEKFILIGSDWSKFSIESRESNYSIKQNKELYRGNICLDLGCIEGSSSLYSRSNQIIESGGLIIQTNQLDYKNKWNQLSEKILFKNFISLDFILEKIFNNYEYANTLLNQIHENFSNTEKLMENSLDEVISYK